MAEITKYDWTYVVKNEKGKRVFEIIDKEKTAKPASLFKLYSLNENAVSSLTEKYIYATHPHQFNDIFDCFEQLIDFDDDEFVYEYLKKVHQNELTDEQLKAKITARKADASISAQRNAREDFYREIGVFSMTSNVYSLLMWSYYTNHQGFFIEFDYPQFPFKFHGPFPLNYQENISPVSLKECGIDLAMLLQTNLKYIGWQHENEWRLLVESDEPMYSPSFEEIKALGGADRKFNYPINAIKSVGFGNRFFEPEELRIENEKILHVTLKNNVSLKAKVLDFLIEHNITTCMSLRDGLVKISFGGMIIKKVETNTYIFTGR